MNKLSKEEQVKRIRQILNNDKMTTCPECKKSYLPLSYETEVICPFCDYELDGPDPLNSWCNDIEDEYCVLVNNYDY